MTGSGPSRVDDRPPPLGWGRALSLFVLLVSLPFLLQLLVIALMLSGLLVGAWIYRYGTSTEALPPSLHGGAGIHPDALFQDLLARVRRRVPGAGFSNFLYEGRCSGVRDLRGTFRVSVWRVDRVLLGPRFEPLGELKTHGVVTADTEAGTVTSDVRDWSRLGINTTTYPFPEAATLTAVFEAADRHMAGREVLEMDDCEAAVAYDQERSRWLISCHSPARPELRCGLSVLPGAAKLG